MNECKTFVFEVRNLNQISIKTNKINQNLNNPGKEKEKYFGETHSNYLFSFKFIEKSSNVCKQ